MKSTLTVLFLFFLFYSFGQAGSSISAFGNNGKVITPFDVSVDDSRATVVQTDGKIVIAGMSFIGSNYDFAIARYNPDGTLDNTFDGDGKVTTSIGTADDICYAVALQSDGKIVAAGRTGNAGGSDNDFALVRYNTDGSLDNTFNGTGKVITSFGPKYDIATAVAIQRQRQNCCGRPQ